MANKACGPYINLIKACGLTIESVTWYHSIASKREKKKQVATVMVATGCIAAAAARAFVMRHTVVIPHCVSTSLASDGSALSTSPLKMCPFVWRAGLNVTQCHSSLGPCCPNVISIGSSVTAWFTVVTNTVGIADHTTPYGSKKPIKPRLCYPCDAA